MMKFGMKAKLNKFPDKSYMIKNGEYNIKRPIDRLRLIPTIRKIVKAHNMFKIKLSSIDLNPVLLKLLNMGIKCSKVNILELSDCSFQHNSLVELKTMFSRVKLLRIVSFYVTTHKDWKAFTLMIGDLIKLMQQREQIIYISPVRSIFLMGEEQEKQLILMQLAELERKRNKLRVYHVKRYTRFERLFEIEFLLKIFKSSVSFVYVPPPQQTTILAETFHYVNK